MISKGKMDNGQSQNTKHCGNYDYDGDNSIGIISVGKRCMRWEGRED